MNDTMGKHHTEAYDYLKAVADRLHSTWMKCSGCTGRNADMIRGSVTRQCIREWDEVILKSINAGHPLEDISAAICRLKDGKKWLGFLTDESVRKAA